MSWMLHGVLWMCTSHITLNAFVRVRACARARLKRVLRATEIGAAHVRAFFWEGLELRILAFLSSGSSVGVSGLPGMLADLGMFGELGELGELGSTTGATAPPAVAAGPLTAFGTTLCASPCVTNQSGTETSGVMHNVDGRAIDAPHPMSVSLDLSLDPGLHHRKRKLCVVSP